LPSVELTGVQEEIVASQTNGNNEPMGRRISLFSVGKGHKIQADKIQRTREQDFDTLF
jgi:hypothetical protein